MEPQEPNPGIPGEWSLLRTLEGHTDAVRSVAFNPAGSLLASAGNDGTVRLWDPAGGECLRTLVGHSDAVESVAFSPTGSLLASASWDKTVQLWSASTSRSEAREGALNC